MTMDDSEQLFGQRRLLQPLLAVQPFRKGIQLLLEKVKRKILLGAKIIKQGPFRDAGLPRDSFGGGSEKSVLGEKFQCGAENGSFCFFLVFGPFARFGNSVSGFRR